MVNPLEAKPKVDHDSKRIVCFNETRDCFFTCNNASVIIALEPICYSLQKSANINPVSHCDYIIAFVNDATYETTVFLVEIDPLLRHRNPKDLQDKLDHCEELLNAFMRTLTHIAISSKIPRSLYKVKRVLLVSYEVLKSKELRELMKQKIIDLVEVCGSSIRGWMERHQ